MKYVIILLTMCSSLIVSAQTPKKNRAVAVLEFQKTGAITNDDVQTLTNRFRAMLFQTNTFNVIERQKMKDILKEQQFILSDECSTNECAVQVGQLLGVEYMIAGDIGLIGDTYTIDLRMIDVGTGQLVQTHSKDHDGKIAGLLEIMKQIANSFSQFQKETAKMKPDEKKAAVSDSKDKQTIRTETKSESGLAEAKNDSKRIAFRLLIGSAIPTGKFKTDGDAETGSNFMISCSYCFTRSIQLGIDMGVQRFKTDYGARFKTVPLLLSGRYYTFAGKFQNYLSLGFGTTSTTLEDPGGSETKSFSTLGLGTGFDYKITKNLSAEMSLNFMSIGSKDKWGNDITFATLGLGINYGFAF